MIELFIEGVKADLSEDIAADITYSLADIRTPDKRQVNYSKTITLVGTATNNFIFGNIFDIDVENPDNNPVLPNIGVNFTPKKLALATLIADGIQVLDGTLRLWKVISKDGIVSYEITLFGKLLDLFGLLADSKLTDLDVSEFNHAITWDNIKATWLDSYTGGFRYPLVDYGVNEISSGGTSFAFGSLLPCLYYKIYIDKIFSSVGATYTLNFSDLTILNKILVTPGYGQIKGSPEYFIGSRVFPTVQTYDPIYDPESYNNYLNLIDSVGVNAIGLSIAPAFYGGASILHFSQIISTSFQYTIDINVTPESGVTYDGVFTLTVYRKRGVDTTTAGVLTIPVTPAGVSGLYKIELPKFDYLVDDELGFVVNVPPYYDFTLGNRSKIIAVSPVDLFEYPLISGSVYDMKKSIPLEIKQVDFLKDFIKLFNLYVTQDPESPSHYVFTPNVDFYETDKANAKDWTNKVDHSETIEFTPIGQLTAKQYVLTWKSDKDYWNELYLSQNKEIYGQVTYISDTDVLTNVETVTMLFSPAVMTRFSGTNIICPAIYKVESVEGVPTKKADKFNSRLLLWGGLKDAGVAIDLLDSDGDFIEYVTQYPYAGHLDDPEAPTFDLNFGNTNTDLPTASSNTFSKYWGKVLREAANKDGKLVSCTMYLKPEDIEALDFSSLYRISNQLYHLNKIEGFNPFELSTSKVELIKVINI